MATAKNGKILPFTGRIGNLVYCNWRGTPYVRTRPNVKNVARSLQQKKLNSRFKHLQYALSKILPYIRVGFRNYNEQWSSHNSAMSYNLNNAMLESESGFQLDWQKFCISHGFENPVIKHRIQVYKKCLIIKWDLDIDILNKLDRGNYRCMILIYPENTQANPVFGIVNGNFIHDKTQKLSFRRSSEDKVYHIYIAFIANDGSDNCTNSKYLGKI